MKRSKLNNQKWDVYHTPEHIGNIRSPLPIVQLIAVKRSRFAIMHIKRPCRAAQIYVINKYPDMVGHIKNIHPDAQELINFHNL